MYRLPSGDHLLFGDIFKAEWFHDAWIEEDAVLLGRFTARGGADAYSSSQATDDQTFLLAHGRVPLAVILLNDDCYSETVLVRQGAGRLSFAPVFGLPDKPAEREQLLKTALYGRLPLPPDDLFAGGVADLTCAFSVKVASKAAAGRFAKERVLSLDDYGCAQLEARLGAHAARRGPLVARGVGTKLASLLPDEPGQRAKRAVEQVLSRTWSAEGGIPDVIDTAVEAGTPPDVVLADILQRVEAIARDAQEAATALQQIAAEVAAS